MERGREGGKRMDREEVVGREEDGENGKRKGGREEDGQRRGGG